MGDRRYTYSKAGNPLTIEGGGVSRSLTWDAENRLRMMEDNESGTLHLYTYSHTGERALKRFGTGQTMSVNGRTVATLLDVNENYSAYVSPYFVENNNRYTKHYYAGTMRLASKIGGAVYKGVDGEQADLEPGSTYTKGTDEPDLYFYFTDHLGSTTYITDREEIAQYAAYTPYGETFIEERDVTPYKFNGKELDQETGYYYYGARYYDPGTALWFGVDPLASKYPMNSPYIYCNGNPVKYVDPDGNAPWDNKNVKDAYDYVSKSPCPNICRVELVDGKYGKDAQVINVKTGSVVHTYEATSNNQKSGIVNTLISVAEFCNSLDEGGSSHAGNTTYTTSQDVAVATGVIGVITGGVALVADAGAVGAVATVAGIMNSADDIGTNTSGESFVQQLMTNETGKNVLGFAKNSISVLNIKNDIKTIIKSSSEIQKVNSVSDLLNNAINFVNSLIKNHE